MAKLGLIQVWDRDDLETEGKWDKLYRYTESCLREGADLVLHPEAYQYLRDRDIVKDPERLVRVSGEWKSRMSRLAKQYGAYIVPWDYYYEDGKVYNSSYILDREGNEIGRYKKCNLTQPEFVVKGLARGTSYPVFELDFAKVGIMICYDNYYPESASILASKGADIILYPLYGDTFRPQWERKLQTRAFEHALYIMSCEIDSSRIAFTGIFGPDGEVIEKMEDDGYKVVEIDAKKRMISCLQANGRDYEYFRDIIHKTRNYEAFAEIATEGAKAKEWEEVFVNGVPKT